MLINAALDQPGEPAHFTAVVTLCEARIVGSRQISKPWTVLRSPFPCWPKDIEHEAFGEAGWNVDDLLQDVTIRDRRQRLAQQLQHPPLDQRCGRLYDRPHQPDKLHQAFLGRGLLIHQRPAPVQFGPGSLTDQDAGVSEGQSALRAIIGIAAA